MATQECQGISSRGGVLWALMLALACVALAATSTNTTTAAIPARNSQAASVGTPAEGGGCWTEISTQNVMTGGNYLNAIDGDDETGAILAAGHYTTDIGLRSDGGLGTQTQMVQFYNGSSFQIVPNPTGLGAGRLNGVASIPGTNNEFWAVGNAATTTMTTTFTLNLILRFDGTSLSIVPNPQPNGVGNWLTDVDASSPSFAIAVGRVQSFTQGLVPVILRWDGAQWLTETPPNFGQGELLGVTTFPDGRAVAVGIDYDPDVRHVMIARDAGGTWSIVSLFLPGTGSRLTAVDATGPTEVVAVGYRVNGQTGFYGPYSVVGNLNTNNWNILSMPDPPDPPRGVISATAGGNDVRVNSVSCAPGGGCKAGGEADRGRRYGVNWSFVQAWLSTTPKLDLQFFAWYFAAEHTLPLDLEHGGEEDMYGAINYNNQGELNRTTVMRYEAMCGGQPTPTPGGPTNTPTPGPPTATSTPIVCTPHVYSDVPSDHTFYPYVTCLSQLEVISGYADCTFRPGNNITRGQIGKVVSNAAGYSDEPTEQTYEDVSPSHPFYVWIERLSSRGHMAGYACGGTNEHCVPPGNRPYFRPQNNATRGQLTKIVSNAAGYSDEPTGQTFEDVTASHTFWLWIERLASRSVIGGYACGGVGEPCVPPNNRPYFRAGNDVTRGQASKITAVAFFPECNP